MSNSSLPTHNGHPEYPAGFYFKLSFNGDDSAFQEVSGLSKEVGIEEVVSGGENTFKYRLPTITTSQNLVLKRALAPKGSQLVGWVSSCMEGGLAAAIIPQDVTVTLMDANGNSYKDWLFHSAYPVKYAVSDFKSQEDSIVIESMELAYTWFEIVPPTNS